MSKITNAVPWTSVVNGLNSELITGSFYGKELQKTSQERFRIEKVLKRKGDKLYVKWKGYDNSFNSSIDKKDLILKWVNNFLNRLEVLKEILTSRWITVILQVCTNLARLETEVDKLDIDKLSPVAADLSN